MKALRLAVVATHPIQYQVPWFRALAARPEVDLKVYFALLPDSAQQGIGFGIPFQWDIPMHEGYQWEALPNARARPVLGSFFGSSTPGILQALRRDRPDAAILSGWNALPLLQALWACERLRLPRIVRGESNAMRLRPAWVRAGHRLLLSRYQAALAIGKANRNFYLANGVDEKSIFPARYFVDNARFNGAAESLRPKRSRLRADWSIPGESVCFLFAGKLEPKKRVLDLIAAIAAMRDDAVRVHLLVVGAGEQHEEVAAAVTRDRLPVTLAGFLNQTRISEAYVAADCLVLPSDYGETWGLVVNEAMASGLPAVVSDRVGCGPDLIDAGVTGEVFPFGDVGALVRVLRSLAADAEGLRGMGRRARERIAAYSVENAVEGTIAAARYVTG